MVVQQPAEGDNDMNQSRYNRNRSRDGEQSGNSNRPMSRQLDEYRKQSDAVQLNSPYQKRSFHDNYHYTDSPVDRNSGRNSGTDISPRGADHEDFHPASTKSVNFISSFNMSYEDNSRNNLKPNTLLPTPTFPPSLYTNTNRSPLLDMGSPYPPGCSNGHEIMSHPHMGMSNNQGYGSFKNQPLISLMGSDNDGYRHKHLNNGNLRNMPPYNVPPEGTTAMNPDELLKNFRSIECAACGQHFGFQCRARPEIFYCVYNCALTHKQSQKSNGDSIPAINPALLRPNIGSIQTLTSGISERIQPVETKIRDRIPQTGNIPASGKFERGSPAVSTSFQPQKQAGAVPRNPVFRNEGRDNDRPGYGNNRSSNTNGGQPFRATRLQDSAPRNTKQSPFAKYGDDDDEWPTEGAAGTDVVDESGKNKPTPASVTPTTPGITGSGETPLSNAVPAKPPVAEVVTSKEPKSNAKDELGTLEVYPGILQVDESAHTVASAENSAEPVQKTAEPLQKTAEPIKKTAEPIKKTAEPSQKIASAGQKNVSSAEKICDIFQKTLDPARKTALPVASTAGVSSRNPVESIPPKVPETKKVYPLRPLLEFSNKLKWSEWVLNIPMLVNRVYTQVSGDFFAQIYEKHKEGEQIALAIEKYVDSPEFHNLETLEPGTLCLAPFDGAYFRGEVLGVSHSGDESIRIFFSDFGNIESVPRDLLFSMSDDLCKNTRLIAHCRWDMYLASAMPQEEMDKIFKLERLAIIPTHKICEGQYIVKIDEYVCPNKFEIISKEQMDIEEDRARRPTTKPAASSITVSKLEQENGSKTQTPVTNSNADTANSSKVDPGTKQSTPTFVVETVSCLPDLKDLSALSKLVSSDADSQRVVAASPAPSLSKFSGPRPSITKARSTTPQSVVVPQRVKYFIKDQKYCDSLKHDSEVFISFIWGEGRYLISGNDNETCGAAIQQLINRNIESCDKLVGDVPVVGEILLAAYNEDEMYRGVIREVDTEARKAKLEFVDYGDQGVVKFEELRIPTAEMMNLPLAGLCVKLMQIDIPKESDIPTEPLANYLEELLQVQFTDEDMLARDNADVILWVTNKLTLNAAVQLLENK